jgi:hypothetical protein
MVFLTYSVTGVILPSMTTKYVARSLMVSKDCNSPLDNILRRPFWKVSKLHYMPLYSPRRCKYSFSENTFHYFSLLVVSKFVQNVVFVSVSLIFTCVIIIKQFVSSGEMNNGECLPRLRFGKYSPIYTSPLVNNC